MNPKTMATVEKTSVESGSIHLPRVQYVLRSHNMTHDTSRVWNCGLVASILGYIPPLMWYEVGLGVLAVFEETKVTLWVLLGRTRLVRNLCVVSISAHTA